MNAGSDARLAQSRLHCGTLRRAQNIEMEYVANAVTPRGAPAMCHCNAAS